MRTLKKFYRKFKTGKPGQRFRSLHDMVAAAGGHAGTKKIVGAALGILLIVSGLFLGLIPGVPGVVLALLGLGVIAAVFPTVAGGIDRFEVWVRRFPSKCRKDLSKPNLRHSPFATTYEHQGRPRMKTKANHQ